MPTEAPAIPRLKERYRAEIKSALQDEFKYPNVMQIPGLTKIVVNMGVGEAARDGKLIDGAIRDLTAITGQKPAVAKAKKSIAQFKLREGMPIGAHVTLRGDQMWSSGPAAVVRCRASPARDLSDKAVRRPRQYSFGLTEQVMFHKINPDRVDDSAVWTSSS
jgi:large subunit ribosomal protein L5